MSRAKRQSPATGAAQTSRADWRWPTLIVAGLATYATSFSGPFLFDDFGSIARNTSIRDLSNLHAVFAPADATAVAGRPLVNLSFALNYAIGGLDVTGYHVVNLACHLAVAVLLYVVVRRTLTAAGWSSANLAFAIALVWAVHPLASEVVLYLSERTESMMAIAYLLTLYASLRAAGSARPGPWLVAGVISCAAGTLCKEVIVTAPFIVVVFDRVFLFGSLADAFRARWRFYAGLAGSWALLAWSMLSHGSISSGGFASAHTTTWTYLMNQAPVVTRYLRLTIWPRPLVLYYGWTRPYALMDVWPYALLLVLLAVAVLAVFFRWPRFGFPAFWALVTLSPSSSIAGIAAEVGAERRMYLPLMGLVALVVISAALWLKTRSAGKDPAAADRSVLVGAMVMAVLLGASTIARTRDYSSSMVMARTILAGWESPSAHQLLGQELIAAGQRDEGVAELRKALPDATPARYFLGTELINAGQLDEGISQLETFIALEPSIEPTKSARLLLARAYAARQQWPQTIAQLNALLAASPDDAAVHGLLANVYASQQAFEEALPHYRAFLKANPHDGNAWTGLGVALISLGRTSEASTAFREAVAAEPRNAHFHQNLSRVLFDAKDAAGATAEAQQAIAIDPSDAGAHDLLGRIFASRGKIDDARREFERALAIDPGYAPAREALAAIGRGR